MGIAEVYQGHALCPVRRWARQGTDRILTFMELSFWWQEDKREAEWAGVSKTVKGFSANKGQAAEGEGWVAWDGRKLPGGGGVDEWLLTTQIWMILALCIYIDVSGFLFVFWPHSPPMGVPVPGLSPSHSSDLHHSFGNTRSLTHSAGLGIKPMPLQRQHWILNPLHHKGNS